MGFSRQLWILILLLIQYCSCQTSTNPFSDTVIEDNLDGVTRFSTGGRTELPTSTPVITITPTTTPSTSTPTYTTPSTTPTSYVPTATLTTVPTMITVSPTATIISTLLTSTILITPSQSQIPVCTEIVTPPNGHVVTTCNGTYCTAEFFCDTGYNLVGTDEFTYPYNGWSGTAPICTQSSCGPLTISHGTYTGTTLFDTSGVVVCDQDYELDGPEMVNCTLTGYTATPTCKLVKCETPTWNTTTTASVTWDCLDVGCTSTHTCQAGYTPTPSSSRRCIRGLGWEFDILCVPVDTGQETTAQFSMSTNYTGEFGEDFRDAAEAHVFNELKKKLGDDLLGVSIIGFNDSTKEFDVSLQLEGQAPPGEVSKALQEVAESEETFDVNGEPVAFGPGTTNFYTGDNDACGVMATIEEYACKDGETCVLDENNVPNCVTTAQPSKGNNNLPLYIGAPLAALAACLLIGLCCYCCCCGGGAAALPVEEEEEWTPGVIRGMLPRFQFLGKINLRETYKAHEHAYEEQADYSDVSTYLHGSRDIEPEPWSRSREIILVEHDEPADGIVHPIVWERPNGSADGLFHP